MRSRLLLASLLYAAGPFLGPRPCGAQAPAAGAEAPNPDFDAEIARLRADSPEFAAECEKLNADLKPLAPYGTYDSALLDVSAAALADYNRRYHALQDHAQVVEKKLGLTDPSYGCSADSHHALDKDYLAGFDYACRAVTLVISDRINRLSNHDVPQHFRKDAAQLQELEARTTRLEGDVKTAGPGLSPAAKEPLQLRLAKLNEDGTALWDSVHADAMNIDESPDGTGKEQLQANPLQTRLSALAKRLQALDSALNGDHGQGAGLQRQGAISDAMRRRLDPFAHLDAADAPVGGAAAVLPGRANDVTGTNLASPVAPRKTLIDLGRTVPPPSSVTQTGPKPPVNAGTRPGEDAAPNETAQVDALRAKGLTRTIGDPAARAAFAFHQTGDTCGIGAQVQALAVAGEVPADPAQLRAKEDQLYARAVALGYYAGSAADPNRRSNGDTPFQYMGDLLDRPVAKYYGAGPQTLLNAAKSGGVVLVNVDSGIFYHDNSLRGQGHSVAITGVELGPAGNALGYYVNDTGTGEGARFINASQFLAAWKERGGTLVVPQ
jgi:hypothetical protein